MKVSFVEFGKSYKEIKGEILKEIDRVLSVGDLILRDDVKKFEENLANFIGKKYAVGLNSGTDALYLSLKVLGIKSGDEVITSGYTFWATIEAIINCGATPILADIKEDLLINPEDIKRKITTKTKAIIPVHIGGTICDMEKICEITNFFGLFLIDDACQALGVGKFYGEISCFSFYPAKILGGFGDGGAITTNDKELTDKIKLLRNHGGKPHPQLVGYNSRLDNLQAAILNIKLKSLPKIIKRRREIAKIYDEKLKDIKEILLPISQVYQEYNIKSKERDELYEFLKENEIETIKGDYTFPIEVPENCKKANQEVLRLPIWPTLKDNQIKYICQKINEFYN